MEKDLQSPLVSAEWLAKHLHTSDIVILDATFFLPNQGRDAEQEYFAAHIPGARFFDIDAVADQGNSLPHMLPSPEFFAASVGQLGIANQTHVVVYDNNSFMASARVWWTFRVFGHDRVSVLDGGLENWKAKGFPVDTSRVTAETRPFKTTFDPSLVRNLDEMKALIGSTATQIIDARSPGRFAGREPEPRPGIRSGHIPGSKNLFFKRLVDESTQCLKPAAEIRKEFEDAGTDFEKPIVTTCGTGVTASVLALGLYCLGRESVAVYDGSWTEWGGLSDTPVSVG
ncbi:MULTISPECIES: 3-mercaptopyruvate sulfurtransferase [Methylocaldum]|jgi:thiosulfate/3-mercaptopyruvate sulfurtransferase|uniref:3-mercaptopyruvate sulfurtransferase n=1 Tax=unclassified Methylocaldum TaxID=2622260 RepID=UPI000989A938|nr:MULTISPECIES: 3-mercaptopyruvate sulfurtransferase [unclassified Methylocaldum]MBP1151706.1 thiosulfate/3-mercaptopyruvate sulfurtransferase [Methylocaldum sp. RMAD-M]MDV3241799.1 3-mercaptopyruvate sulfurtransferase [Methylocaldum sp.]